MENWLFENIELHTNILTAPWIIWEKCETRRNLKNWKRTPRKKNTVYSLWYGYKWYPSCIWFLYWKSERQYSSSFINETYRGTTPQEIEAKEEIFETDYIYHWENIYCIWYKIDWKIYMKRYFILIPLSDKEWLHERTLHTKEWREHK